jgi:hypothetical protein
VGTKTELAKTSANAGRKTAYWTASLVLDEQPATAITHDKARRMRGPREALRRGKRVFVVALASGGHAIATPTRIRVH